MEEVLRENDQIKMKRKRLPKDENKSEYRMKIAREKLEASIFTKKMQDMERIEHQLINRLEHTQDNRRNLLDQYNSMVFVSKPDNA